MVEIYSRRQLDPDRVVRAGMASRYGVFVAGARKRIDPSWHRGDYKSGRNSDHSEHLN